MKKIALRLLLAVTLLLPGTVMGAPALAQSPDSGTTVEVTEGEFKGLKVTVSQTKDLINQSVTVSWTGGTATPSSYNNDFLQIMQCWGDDPTGPDRTQCQFGAIIGDPPNPLGEGGAGVRSREVDRAGPMDPRETTYKVKDDPTTPVIESQAFVPFWAAGEDKPTERNKFGTFESFDAQITNEIPVARTGGDGNGKIAFEVQTVLEAAGLGCGEVVTVDRVTKPRSCWLVIVPRGSTEVDGVKRPLATSALSQSNWDNNIAIRLEFRPVDQACPLGAAERRLTGHELVVEAVSSWQPALCADGGAIYGFTQLSDDLSRSNLLETSDPGLSLMSGPVPPPELRPDRPLVYGPVAISGLVFAFNIVKQPRFEGGDHPNRALEGVPFTEMKLTPRLVAKLLTQSYTGSIANNNLGELRNGPAGEVMPPRLEKNYIGLTHDPEFLEINGEYADLQYNTRHVDALVQLGTSDLTAQLWDWVLADQEAREFLSGKSDESGMVVNEFNKNPQSPLGTIPRNDPSCRVTVDIGVMVPNCTSDAHQFANDMHDAARSASRGDTLSITLSYDLGLGRLKTDKSRQILPNRGLIAMVDVATAHRYGLPTAELRNAAEQYVKPSEAGLRAGVDAMKPSVVPGVLQPDPATMNRDAYPLTSLSYAATSPPTLTEVAGREYAAFLRHAAGPGQQPGTLPGQLPFGYAPLPEPLRAQTLAAATTIENQAGKPIGGDPPGDTPTNPDSSNPGSANPGSANPGSTNTGSTNTGSTQQGAGGLSESGSAGTTPPGSGPAASALPGAPAAAPGTDSRPVGAVRRTPALPAPAVGALLVALLIGGGLAAALAPVTHLLGTHGRPSRGGDMANQTVIRRSFSWSTARSAFFARRR